MEPDIEHQNDLVFFGNSTSVDITKHEDLKCNQYIVNNKTHIFYGGYEGIPETLLINFIAWVLLLSLFTVLRKNAWNYGRLALVQKYESRRRPHGYSGFNVWTRIFYASDNENRPSTESDSISSYEFNVRLDQGAFSWFTAIFKIQDDHILSKCGRDAVQYLSFQRHIITYMTIVCVVCITIILPINFQGNLEGDEKEFGHTTMSNLDPSSSFMWVHVTLAFLLLPLGIVFTRHFSRMLSLKELSTPVSRTLMITRVPRRACHKDTILKHFQEAYEDIEVTDVQFAYDIHKLASLDKDREVVHSALMYCDEYYKENNIRLEMRAYRCGVICSCCDIFGCPKVDAIEFYKSEEHMLEQELENEKVKALQRPTGIAFVTFDTVENAKRVMNDHLRGCSCVRNVPTSSVAVDLKPYNWFIHIAPHPDDIYWANLSVTRKNWYLKAFFINLWLFIFLFFLTTPPMIFSYIDKILPSAKLSQLSPILSEFVPTLILWTVAALMPVIVAYSDQFMSHWTRSAQNHSVMRKTFIFLLFMLVILPSLGFTSAKAFVEWMFNTEQKGNQTYRWECVFLPDNGAFFVNYVITSAFIGTALELIRFPELFLYIIRLALAKSEAETASIRKNILYEFQFGVQYAWMLLIFAMTVIYSVSCPLITPFGLVYMVFKHLVDKYNIYFAYGPSKIRKSVHTTAINFVIVSVVILQLCMLFFSLLRLGLTEALTIYSIILLCIAFLVFITHNAFHWFKDFSPIEYKKSSLQDETQTDDDLDIVVEPRMVSHSSSNVDSSYRFIPAVLRSSSIERPNNHEPPIPLSRRSYGTEIMDDGPNYQNYSPTVNTVSAEVDENNVHGSPGNSIKYIEDDFPDTPSTVRSSVKPT